ncbi:MAG: YihY/virulence factor BrkB family protein [Anaerolineae bacterium]|jgi:membrane protein
MMQESQQQGSREKDQGPAQAIGRIEDALGRLYRGANRLTGGRLGLVRRTIESFGQARSAQSAAGMAYYAFFSLFPLTLFLVSVVSTIFVQERQQAMTEVINLIRRAIPISPGLIRDNVQQVLDARGTVGVIGAVGTLWSATGFFSILSTNINRAWPGAEPRNFFEQRLVALSMIAILLVLLVLSLASTAILNILSPWQIPLLDSFSLQETLLWRIVSSVVPWFFAFLLFLALYRWTPNIHVSWRAAGWAALVVSLVWQLAASTFAWYVSSGLARYQLVYGSLGTIIALLFWIYLTSWFTLFGAHLSASIDGASPAERPQKGAK